MKNIFKLLALGNVLSKTTVVVIFFAFTIFVSEVFATVGGPTFVYDLKFDPKTETIYYTEQSLSGKGCPPELKSIKVVSGDKGTVYSCDESFVFSDSDQRINERINVFTSEMKILSSINLKKNNIEVLIKELNVEKIEESFVVKTNFTATILQNGKKVDEIAVSGCKTEQPFIIDGYHIPEDNNKVLLLISTKNDCYEGGYIGESLHVISGVKIVDETHINTYKTNSALVPNEGSLIVYGNDTAKVSTSFNRTSIVVGIFALIIGIIGGRFMRF